MPRPTFHRRHRARRGRGQLRKRFRPSRRITRDAQFSNAAREHDGDHRNPVDAAFSPDAPNPSTPFDPAKLIGLQWTFAGNPTNDCFVDVFIDDVTFYRDDGGPVAQGCSFAIGGPEQGLCGGTGPNCLPSGPGNDPYACRGAPPSLVPQDCRCCFTYLAAMQTICCCAHP